MHRLLLTGVSGTGKSAIVAELRARGHDAVDLDSPEYSEWIDTADLPDVAGTPVEPERDWVWRADRVCELLDADHGGLLFVSGCAANMGPFLPRFDRVVLLSAPADVIAARLRARPEGQYGHGHGEVERALGLIETVEPLLRRAAHREIDTSGSVKDAAIAVLAIARELPG